MAMIVVALLVMGVISFQNLPVQELPNVSFPFVVVVINYPGASPEDMEQLVTQPVENAVSGVSGIQQLYGGAREQGETSSPRYVPLRPRPLKSGRSDDRRHLEQGDPDADDRPRRSSPLTQNDRAVWPERNRSLVAP